MTIGNKRKASYMTEVIHQHLRSYRKWIQSIYWLTKTIAHYNIFHWKWNQNADTPKNTAVGKGRWSEVQVCSLSKETLVFLWQRRTRVAKLNEHLLCNFGPNSKLWAANWPITGWKQTYLYDKLFYLCHEVLIESLFTFYAQSYNFQFVAICFRNNKHGRFFVVLI